MFKYGSDLLEDMVEATIGNISPKLLSSMNQLQHINDNEKAILFLSYKWMEAAGGTDEDRLNIHKQQFHFVMYSMGPIVNYLTEEEWNETEEEWNELLAHLRSFNGTFLGLYYQRNQINAQTADFYNLLAWVTGLYSMFGANVYQKLRPRIIDDKQGQGFIDSNKCMTTLHMNMMDFFIRYGVNDIQDELLDFTNNGLRLIMDFPGGSWEAYFDGIDAPPTPPAFSIL